VVIFSTLQYLQTNGLVLGAADSREVPRVNREVGWWWWPFVSGGGGSSLLLPVGAGVGVSGAGDGLLLPLPLVVAAAEDDELTTGAAGVGINIPPGFLSDCLLMPSLSLFRLNSSNVTLIASSFCLVSLCFSSR